MLNNIGGYRLSNEKIRIEIRFDPEKDKDIIDFIDENGSTRAGFIKQVLKMYKNESDKMLVAPKNEIEESKHEVKEFQTLTDLEQKLLTIIQYENNQYKSSYLTFLKDLTGHPEKEVQEAIIQLIQQKWLSANDEQLTVTKNNI